MGEIPFLEKNYFGIRRTTEERPRGLGRCARWDKTLVRFVLSHTSRRTTYVVFALEHNHICGILIPTNHKRSQNWRRAP
jgi:hypothetical protein